MKSPLEDYCICTNCGKAYTDGYHKMCDKCRARQKDRMHDYYTSHPDYRQMRYQRLKAAGLCIECRKPAAPGRVMCERCAAIHRIRDKKQLKNHYREQGLCIWCGAERVEGKMVCPACYEKILVNQRKATAASISKRRKT